MLQKLLSWPLILLLLVGGPVFAYLGHARAERLAAIADHGKSAVATIESVEWSKKRGVESKFSINVVFDTADGQSIKTKLTVDGELGRTIRDGNTTPEIEVNYLPEDPKTVFIAGTKEDTAVDNAIGGGAFAAGVILMFIRLRRRPAHAAAA